MTPRKKPRIKKPSPPPTPKQSQPWDAPPLPAKGDDDDRDTFEWVGRALSQWEFFEAYFGLIFGVLIGVTDDTEPAMRAYGSVLTFRGRADMVKVASDAFFKKHTHGAMVLLTDLINEAEKFAPRRNEIAHGIVQLYFPDGENESGHALVPSRHATKKRKLARQGDQLPYRATPAYAYTSGELKEFTAKFNHLAKKTVNLHRNLFHELPRLRRALP